jgi:tRNA(fMet)-specific endonuclease VapC
MTDRLLLLLDTDVVSHLFRGTAKDAIERAVATFSQEQCCISAITVGEIVFGYEKAGPERRSDLAEMERRFLSRMGVLPFDEPAARVYGKVRADLRRRNLTLDEPDLRIAAIALSRDLILATGNRRHFERVDGLRLLDW